MGDPQHGFAEGESGFEGIFHDKTQDGMYVVREAPTSAVCFSAFISRHRRDGGGSFTPSPRRPILFRARRVRRRHGTAPRDGSPEVPRHRHADFVAASR